MLYFYMAFLSGLEKAPTFLVPIINPPFADNSPPSLYILQKISYSENRLRGPFSLVGKSPSLSRA
jgi:hypothetical protein